ncbi:MAG TPA: YbaK/EbsC family protein [Rhodopila sp.]|uniref:YbaK/EbsC family protein n=1 Tax=Rhodopila sp. TaxID=2480087 RepID=UPI002BC35BE2|nr:YbaK/EbsC family protein [Rhodopila sp.]HVY15796.1 YbaK/EbsC family protein [Rhodopila sp.]
MKPAETDGAKRIQALLGDAYTVVEFEESTHSSAEAAAAIGCEVAQIAKSMLFQAADGRGVLVVASGANRVDEKKVAALLGQKIKRATPDFVAESGFVPGGVAPIGHTVPPVTFLDGDLRAHAVIWAAAGSPNAIFRLTPQDLVTLTGAAFADVAKTGAQTGAETGGQTGAQTGGQTGGHTGTKTGA